MCEREAKGEGGVIRVFVRALRLQLAEEILANPKS